MASSCTFILNGDKTINTMCFAEMISRNDYKEKIIIIEKNKQHYSLRLIKSYLNDLKKLFEYNGYKINSKGIIEVDVSNITDKLRLRLLTMATRYLWEGKFSNTQDKFFYIVEGYFKIKRQYPNNTILKNLCIAHNYFMVNIEHISRGGYHRPNSNHMWCDTTGCRIRETLEELSGQYTQENFARPGRYNDWFPIFETPKKRWSKKKFEELIKIANSDEIYEGRR